MHSRLSQHPGGWRYHTVACTTVSVLESSRDPSSHNVKHVRDKCLEGHRVHYSRLELIVGIFSFQSEKTLFIRGMGEVVEGQSACHTGPELCSQNPCRKAWSHDPPCSSSPRKAETLPADSLVSLVTSKPMRDAVSKSSLKTKVNEIPAEIFLWSPHAYMHICSFMHMHLHTQITISFLKVILVQIFLRAR